MNRLSTSNLVRKQRVNTGDACAIQLENLNWNVSSHDKAKLQNVFNFNNHCSNSKKNHG